MNNTKENYVFFKEQRCTERHLKKKCTSVFDEACLLDLKEDKIRHNNAAIQDMFDHLNEYYGKIIDSNLLENKATMTKG